MSSLTGPQEEEALRSKRESAARRTYYQTKVNTKQFGGDIQSPIPQVL